MPEGKDAQIAPATDESKVPTRLATDKEVARARAGVQDFAETFAKSSLSQRRFLRYGQLHDKLQSMFLGIKPLTVINPLAETIKNLPLPARFHVTDQYVYDEEQVQAAIEENPDVFDDITEINGNISAYLHDLLTIKTAQDYRSSEKDTVRIGILFGYPREAVLEFARYSSMRIRVMNFLAQHAPRLDTKVDSERQRLTDLFPELKPDELDYIVEVDGVSTHGLNFGARKTSEAYQNFPKKVDELYESSGMNRFLSRTRLLIPTSRP